VLRTPRAVGGGLKPAFEIVLERAVLMGGFDPTSPSLLLSGSTLGFVRCRVLSSVRDRPMAEGLFGSMWRVVGGGGI